MNTLYNTIHQRCRARITPDTPIDEYCNIWFAVADKYLKELQKEGLTETVKELERIIEINKQIANK